MAKGKTSSKPTPAPIPEAAAQPAKAPRKKPIVKTGNAGNSASSVSTPAKPQIADGLFGSWTGKVPLSLLNEHCQKRGWDRPIVDAKRIPNSDKFSCNVILRSANPKDPHGQHLSVLVKPPKDNEEVKIECSTAQEAKHFGATLALFRFANGLSLKMTLPPLIRDYWYLLEKWKASSPKSKAWLFDADPFSAAPTLAPSNKTSRSATPQADERPSRPASPKLPKFWQDAVEVRMAPHQREKVQQLIQSHMHILNDGDNESQAEPIDEDAARATVRNLLQLGFRQGHAERAVTYLRQAKSKSDPVSRHLSSLPLHLAAIEYLTLLLSEDDLPPSFHQKHSTLANATISSHSDSASLARTWTLERIHKDFGYPLDLVQECMTAANDNEASCLYLALQRLVGKKAELPTENQPVDQSLQAEEAAALESIYADRYRDLGNGKFEIEITLDQASSSRRQPDDLALLIWMHPASAYPSDDTQHNIPTFACKSNTLPAYIRLHLNTLLEARLRELDLADLCISGGVISELVELLSSIAPDVIASPPDPASVFIHLITAKSRPLQTVNGQQKSRTKRNQHQSRRPTGDSNAVKTAHEKVQSTPAYQKMLRQRQSLPAWPLREEIVKTIDRSRVTLVCGETGSGKTTQVPAMVLDAAIEAGQGGGCSILVTQPRRVAAIGVATRVAAERTEDLNTNPGLVGYSIRGESKSSPACRLRFLTTGVLLRRMISDPDLDGISHVFVDEVHERSVDSDFLLLELKSLLARNKKIKVVLMSATIQQSTFANYYKDPPMLTIPGRTFPVRDFYMEDIIQATDYMPKSAKASRNFTKEEQDTMQRFFIDNNVSDPNHLSTLGMLSRSDQVDFELLAKTVSLVLERLGEAKGAILVFVSGVGEIAQATTSIRSAVSARLDIIPLHASLPSVDQTRAFGPGRHGRKVIISTPVAETSLTIEDVVCVVDTGKVKETRYDPATNLSKLEEVWTSRASGKQRRGRAGRVREGDCYKLYTKWTETHKMVEHTIPEIQRTPLEQVVLSVKASKQAGTDVQTYLGQLISPPNVQAITGALAALISIGAIEREGSQGVTPLGRILSNIPVDLRLGKMLVLGVCFKALESVCYMTAMLSSKPLFLTMIDKREETRAARATFETGNSDLLTDLQALRSALLAGEESKSGLRGFCESHSMNYSSIVDIKKLAFEYFTALQSCDLLPYKARLSSPELNTHGHNHPLLKAIIFGGTNNLARAKLPEARYEERSSGAVQTDISSRELKYFDETGRVFVHPSSIMFQATKIRSGFLTWVNKQITTKPFLRDCAEVGHWPILLLGTLKMNTEAHGIVLENQMRMRCWNRIGYLSAALRRLLAAELEQMFEQPSTAASGGQLSAVIETMLQLIELDGA